MKRARNAAASLTVYLASGYHVAGSLVHCVYSTFYLYNMESPRSMNSVRPPDIGIM